MFEQSEDHKRTVTLDNGNKIHFKKTDPYGFWVVNYNKGQLPKQLKGVYTSYNAAWKHVQAYLIAEKKKKPEKVVEENAS